MHSNAHVYGENLNTREKSDKRQQRWTKDRSRSKSQTRYKCFQCDKEGHFKRVCPESKKNGKDTSKEDGEASVSSNGYNSAETLTISNNQNSNEWNLDFGCTFPMCHTKSWFESLQESDQGLVILGNDRACKVRGVGSIRLRIYDGSYKGLLQQARYVPDLRRKSH